MAIKSLELAGEEQFAAAPETVYNALTDLDVLAANIPNLESSQRAGADTLHAVVRPGVSFLRGTMRLAITIDRTEPPKTATMQVAAKGIGVTMRIESRLTVTPEAGGSKLNWQAQVTEATGLVATISPALIKAAADQIIRRSWSQLRQHLGE